MKSPKLKNNNAASACNTNGTKKEKFHLHNNTIGLGGRKPSRLRAIDYTLKPLWDNLPRSEWKKFFIMLETTIGTGKLYGVLAASYLRHLSRKEAI